MVPEKIGRYEIERRVGRGGMAIIYLANDPLMKRLVAIKLLPRQLTFDPQFKTRFLREVEVIAALEHPAIVPVYDFGEEDGQPYFVMRYMSGGSLVERLRYGTISVADSGRIVSQVAPALDAAHRKSIIHRDIKPGNILFDSNDNTYLSDFGIVKIASEAATFTGTTLLGTPSYMSPELARGDTDIDGRSDIYALGVLLFRMWAGVLPYTANTPLGIAMKHITEPVPRILDYKPDLPEECDTLISIAMAKERRDRFPTATEMAQTLERIIAQRVLLKSEAPIVISVSGAKDRKDQDLKTDSGEPLEPQPTQHPISTPAENNLPAPASSFIGRWEELSEIGGRLNDPDCRLLTLLGPGGIGKTRLAIEAARGELYHFEHGVFFVALAPLSSPEFIVPRLAETIHFAFYSEEDPKVQLINFLKNKHMLLVLDNFEHIIDGAELLVEIMQQAQGVKFLITSRERLNLQEEWILQVHGMQVPSEHEIDAAEDFPAMQLFLERARKVKPDFSLGESGKHYAVRICHLLEGVPLGIELAAAWVRMLSSEEIATEIEQNLDFLTTSLRNVSKRHRSLRAVFEYSWDLLAEGEKETFSKLTVFRGGFTRQAAAKIAEASLTHLSTLVDKSLLSKNPNGRYEMLEVLKQYGHEKLGEKAHVKSLVESRHGAYFTKFLQQHTESLRGGDQIAALNEVGIEIENVRQAIHWAIDNRKYASFANLLDSFYRFFEIRGWLQEGAEILEEMSKNLHEHYGSTDSLAEDLLVLYSRVLARQGAFFYRMGKHDEAEAVLEKSIDLARPLNVSNDLAFALTYLGAVAYLRQDYSRAKELLQESSAIFQETSDHLGTAIALHHLALIARETEEFTEARELFDKGLELNRRTGNRFGIAISLNNLGMIAREMGDNEEAKRLHLESLNIRRELNDRWGIANSLDGLGLVEFQMGNNAQAKTLLEESAEIYEEIGDQRRLERIVANLAHVLEALAE